MGVFGYRSGGEEFGTTRNSESAGPVLVKIAVHKAGEMGRGQVPTESILGEFNEPAFSKRPTWLQRADSVSDGSGTK